MRTSTLAATAILSSLGMGCQTGHEDTPAEANCIGARLCGEGGGGTGSGGSGGSGSAPTSQVVVLDTYDVAELNETLALDTPTVDIAVHLTDQAFVTWDEIKEQIRRAQEIFGVAGVQIRILSARRIRIPEEWQKLNVNQIKDIEDPGLIEQDVYEYFNQVHTNVTTPTLEALSAILPPNSTVEPTIHVISLQQTTISVHERVSETEWSIAKVSTGAVSFPSYVYADRLPGRIAGTVILNPGAPGGSHDEVPKTLAHEMGHVLINVSHEGAGICPGNVTSGAHDLMLYGKGTAIPAGEGGRWHRERLLLSPYLYRAIDSKDSLQKTWNKPYVQGGHYDDSIYGSYAMSPVCPEDNNSPPK